MSHFARRNRKTAAPTSSLIPGIKRIYNFHTDTPLADADGDGWMYGCFIDIGIRNMAVRFSKANIHTHKIEGINQSKYDYDLSKGRKAEKQSLKDRHCHIGIGEDKFAMMTRCFMDMSEWLSLCHYIVIEQQIPGATLNLEVMYRLEGVLSVILHNRGRRPIVIEIDPSQKTVPLDGPRGMKEDKGIKDWCYVKAKEILYLNGGSYDIQLLEQMQNMTKTGRNKRDDPADTVCYCYVWWTCFVFKGLVTREKLENMSLEMM